VHLLDAVDVRFLCWILIVLAWMDLQGCSGVVSIIGVKWRHVRRGIFGVIVDVGEGRVNQDTSKDVG